MRTSTALSAFAAAMLLLVPSADAQSQQSAPNPSPSATPQQGTPSAAAISDQKIEATAKAIKGVTAIKQDYEQKLAAAPEPDKGRVVDEANHALAKAVTDQGLSIEEYTRILQVAQNDPTVHEKIIQKLK